MKVNPRKTRRVVTQVIVLVTVLYVCGIISDNTTDIDKWRDLTSVHYIRRNTALPVFSSNNDIYVGTKKKQSTHIRSPFTEALSNRADADRYIILAMTDEAFIDMAINFYEASLRAHHVENFLFVGVGPNTCNHLSRLDIPCFYYTNDPSATKASSYRQPGFIRKMNIRTNMILDALASNFTVIHTDIDVAFLGNPLQHIKVIGLMNGLLGRPTAVTEGLHKRPCIFKLKSM